MKTPLITLLFTFIINILNFAVGQEAQIVIDNSPNSNQPAHDNLLSGAYGEGAEQYNLGYQYLYGKGVKQSNTKAKEWFDLATQSNSPAVRYKIGRLYETGVLYQKDISKAVFHYEFSAEKGDIYAINNLAILYFNGTGIEKDVKKSIALFTRAAKRGNVEAQVNLGLYYLNELQGNYSLETALKWFTEAAKDNNPVALYYLAEYAFAQKNYIKAYDYYLLSAQQSNDNAQLKLAMLFAKGLGTEKNNNTAIDWLTKAAKLGNKKAVAMLQSQGK
jgi:TPR repeat protein